MVLVTQGCAQEGHDPVAHHLVDGALIVMDRFHHALEDGVRELPGVFGSRSASSSMEPLRSANRTVTCLRSPSRALLEVRIFSARCLGVYVSGDPNCGGAVIRPSDVPHSPQNFWPGGFGL